MRLLLILRLILTFYKNFVLATSLITASSVFIFYKQGIETFSALFWFKLVTLGLIFFVVRSFKAKEFHYYQNLGVSRTLLWTTTLSFDFVLFILSLILTYKFK